MTDRFETAPGRPHPLGATADDVGVNFSVFSEHASAVELLLFDPDDTRRPIQIVELEPRVNRTFWLWHVFVKGLAEGAHYAYRVAGPAEPDRGHRFDRTKVLLDPFARAVSDELFVQRSACGTEDNVTTSLRSVVVDDRDYDWEGDSPLHRPLNETVIYELHVGGFTKSPTAKVDFPGTFAGLVQKIPYLQELGITAVELLPVFAYNHRDLLPHSPQGGEPLHNYWGYDPYAHSAPHPGYCLTRSHGSPVRQFRDMVKAMHRAGIEVIVDVVFNHTAEGNELGPSLSLRGLENSVYYLSEVDQEGSWAYANYSGCGNSLNANHPIVVDLIAETLAYWVSEMHVDGFRFDEASVMSRGQRGSPLEFAPMVWRIELSPLLAETKIIAEAWDAGGLYQVGQFPGRWGQWNGRYRDEIRAFVRGEPGMVGAVASRTFGSADIFESVGELPTNSINFVTAHDGFTLNDLVSYDRKHNEANGEEGRDGQDDNRSWNCGVEGDTDNPLVDELRRRQIKNFAVILLISQGVPMFAGGDEVRRTQGGNNNAYCHDTEMTWMNWNLVHENADIWRFFRLMMDFRRRHTAVRRRRFVSGLDSHHGLADIAWHGCKLGHPGWNDPNARALAFTIAGLAQEESDLHVMMNMHSEPLEFEIPTTPSRRWRRAVDTAEPSPHDILEMGAERAIAGPTMAVRDRSIVILVARPLEEEDLA